MEPKKSDYIQKLMEEVSRPLDSVVKSQHIKAGDRFSCKEYPEAQYMVIVDDFGLCALALLNGKGAGLLFHFYNPYTNKRDVVTLAYLADLEAVIYTDSFGFYKI